MTKPLIEREFQKYKKSNYMDVDAILLKCRLEFDKRINEIEPRKSGIGTGRLNKYKVKKIHKEIYG